MSAPPPLPPWATPNTDGLPAPNSPLDRQFAAFIGPRWPTYRRKFRPFFEDDRFQPTWNWAPALAMGLAGPFGAMWFAYRRLVVPAMMFFLLPSIAIAMLWSGDPITLQDIMAGKESARDFQIIAAGVQLSMTVLAGGTANYLLYRRARAAMRLAATRGLDAAQTEQLLQSVGRPSWMAVAVAVVLLLLLNRLFVALGGVLGKP